MKCHLSFLFGMHHTYPQNAKMHIYRAKQLHQILNVQDMLTESILLRSSCLFFIGMTFLKKMLCWASHHYEDSK